MINDGRPIQHSTSQRIERVLGVAGIRLELWRYFSAADASYMDLECGVRVRILWARFKGQADKVDVSLGNGPPAEVRDIEQLPDMIRALTKGE